jgi:hypothetical protein
VVALLTAAVISALAALPCLPQFAQNEERDRAFGKYPAGLFESSGEKKTRQWRRPLQTALQPAMLELLNTKLDVSQVQSQHLPIEVAFNQQLAPAGL